MLPCFLDLFGLLHHNKVDIERHQQMQYYRPPMYLKGQCVGIKAIAIMCYFTVCEIILKCSFTRVCGIQMNNGGKIVQSET